MELLFIAILIPHVLACVLFLIRNLRAINVCVALGAWVQFALLFLFTYPLITQQVQTIVVTGDFFLQRIDAAFVLLTAAMAACAFTHGCIFFERESTASRPPTLTAVRLNHICTLFFALAMCAVYFCKNLGFLWICIESTTLLSAPLVYFGRTKHALEATWKYLIICSVGISFALLGTLFIFSAGQHGAVSGGTLQMTELLAAAPKLEPQLLRFGYIFCLLGYGTKCGMFPLHSWLPDAHSEAPAPSSAMLSGALLNCALFAIWRITEIVDASSAFHLGSKITLWTGTVTVLAGSLFLVRQYSLKRLLAYSSIENVGVMLFAIGLGSGPLFFFQAVNHSIAKVALFLLSGNIIQGSGRKNLSHQSGLLASAPGWAVLLLLGTFAGIGAPPFGTFISEWMILIRAVERNDLLNATLLLVGLSLGFIVVSRHIGKLVLGARNPRIDYFRPIASSAIPLILIACSFILGITAASTMCTGL